MSNLQRNLIVFGRLLRRAGIDVHVGRMIDVTDALQHVDIASRDEVFHTCRALLVHRHDDLATFDRAFDAFWDALQRPAQPSSTPRDAGDLPAAASGHPPGLDEGNEPTDAIGDIRTWSDAATIADKDFG